MLPVRRSSGSGGGRKLARRLEGGRRFGWTGTLLAACLAPPLAGSLAVGCAEPITSQSADPSRALTPVPACVRRMPARRDADRGFMRQLGEREYWSLVFAPGSSSEGALPPDGRTCSGIPLFTEESFEGTEPASGALTIPEDAILHGGGGNRLRIVWLKSHKGPDGSAAGALAMVRALDDMAEVYAVGAYRGDPERTRLQVERMGHGLVVTAVDERCAGEEPTEPCDSLMHVYVPYQGRLTPFAQVPLRRIRFGKGTEPGIPGRVRYELVTAPTFEEGAVRLVEQVSATDESGKKLRRAELERVLVVREGRAEATSESLWDRMVAERLGEGTGPAPAPASGSEGGAAEEPTAALTRDATRP